MEKRYQVFISSTFEDLKDERQSVLKAILELNQMPAGMELFPASDDEAWDLIKDVIDASDYYVLIIGGRYGSLDAKGIGFTEKEYDYAVEKAKPVIPLLHKNPDNLPRGKTETDLKAWQKLKSFREKVENNHTRVLWETPEELKAKVIVALTTVVKRHPAKGWMRADKLINEDTLKELLELRKSNSELISQLNSVKTGPPEGVEQYVQGDDEFEAECSFRAKIYDKEGDYEYLNYTGNFSITWNEIWGSIAPKLINEASEFDLSNAFDKCFEKKAREVFEKDKDFKNADLLKFSFKSEDYDTCKVQFRALGLMQGSIKQRSIKDTKTYWTLTSYGDKLMVALRAIRKFPIDKKTTKGKVTKDKK